METSSNSDIPTDREVTGQSLSFSPGFWDALSYSIEREIGFSRRPSALSLKSESKVVKFPELHEEQRLIRRAVMGDENAVCELVRIHQPIVQSYVRRYNRSYPSLAPDDLNSEAQIALISAISKFDLSKGVRFVSYLKWSVLAAMQQQVNEFAGPLKIPRREFRNSKSAPDYQQELNKEFSELEEEVLSSESEAQGASSESAVHTVQVRKVGLEDIAEIPSEEDSVLSKLIEAESWGEIEARFQGLPDRDRQILCRHYGIECEATSLSDIAADLGLSRQRVGQLLHSAIKAIQVKSL